MGVLYDEGWLDEYCTENRGDDEWISLSNRTCQADKLELNFAEGNGSCNMKMRKQKTWQHEITGIAGNTILFGVNIFDYQWNKKGQKAEVCDPRYGQEYSFPVYTVVIKGEEHEFAAGEFSNDVWGFFLLK